jgi:hypothetical protein
VEAQLRWLLTSALDGSELSSSRHGRLALGERGPVLTEEKIGWAPEPVRALWKTEKSLYPTKKSKDDSSVLQAIAWSLRRRCLYLTASFPPPTSEYVHDFPKRKENQLCLSHETVINTSREDTQCTPTTHNKTPSFYVFFSNWIYPSFIADKLIISYCRKSLRHFFETSSASLMRSDRLFGYLIFASHKSNPSSVPRGIVDSYCALLWVTWEAVTVVEGIPWWELPRHMLDNGALVYPSQGGRYRAEGCMALG